MAKDNGLMDPAYSVLLMVDHQSGLLQVVKDLSVSELRTSVSVISKAASLAGVPVVATASVPAGPNGPLLPEIFENAPHATYVQRLGQINAGTSRVSAGRCGRRVGGRWSSPAS
jgi:nicotinamidase-related amidase